MDRKRNISVFQMFAMLFISRTIINVTYSTYFTGNDKLWNWILPTVISCILTFVAVLPVYFLHKDDPQKTIVDKGFVLFGRAGIIVAVAYVLYFIVVLFYTMTLFDLFVKDVMNPRVSAVALSIGVLLAACYGAYKGVEAIARISGIVFIGILAAGIMLICLLIPEIDPLNYTPVSFSDQETLTEGIMNMLARNTCIPAMAMLFPFVKGNLKKGIAAWGIAIYAGIALLIFFLTGVLGDFITTQLFPVFAATSVARVGVFERLDAVYLAIWTSGMFIKLSLFIFLIAMIVEKLIGITASKISMIVSAAVVLGLAYISTISKAFMSFVLDSHFLFLATLLTAVIIPLLCLVTAKIKQRGTKKGGEKS